MSVWKLTVRHGPDVARERFENLDEALAEMRRRADEVRAEGPLEGVESLRDFDEGCLPIFSRDVLAKIRAADPAWEEMVPPAVAAMIKERKLFNYGAAKADGGSSPAK